MNHPIVRLMVAFNLAVVLALQGPVVALAGFLDSARRMRAQLLATVVGERVACVMYDEL